MSKLDDIFHTLFNEVEGEIWEAYYDGNDGKPYREAGGKVKQLITDIINECNTDTLQTDMIDYSNLVEKIQTL